MTKSVTGFQTTDGAFFENETDANLHETRSALKSATQRARKFNDTDNTSFETLLLFIEDNAATVHAYCAYYLQKYPEYDANGLFQKQD